MPGNEVGDRIQNLFNQGSLSQEQRRSQLVEGNWPVYHTNVWGANERQTGGPLNSSSKNFSTLQSENDRGQSNQFSPASHGLNFTESTRPEFAKNSSQNQQFNLNGLVRTPPRAHARQNEANFCAGARESDPNCMALRGLPILESQRSGSQHNNSASFGGSESPMNFNFLGGQQQTSGQQPGMVQTLPHQQSAVNDVQILQQQQVMLKQMQELQRRQQLQQFEAVQRSATNHVSAFPNQAAVQHTATINGTTMHDTSDYHWQSQVMAGNTNWQQHGHPSAVHGYFNGHKVTPELGQSMRFMGLVPQQASQSLYGVPVSSSGGANPFTLNSVDRPGGLHAPAPSNAFPGNPYVPHAEQVSTQDGSTVSRSGSEGRSSFEHASSQGLGTPCNLGGFNLGQSRNVSIAEVGGQDFVGGSDVLSEQTVIQGTGSQVTSSQAATALDPTEEKFLFGNDVNIWEAFGSDSGNDGADPFNGLPSMQSGTWSALMQSAVAETSSSDAGIQDELSGLGSQNFRPVSNNRHPPNSHNDDKLPLWVDSSQRPPMSSQTTSNDVSTNNASSNTNYLHSLQNHFSNQRSLHTGGGIPQERRRWLHSQHAKPPAENLASENPNSLRELSENDISSFSHRHSTILPESAPNSNVGMSLPLANSKADAVESGPRNLNARQESSNRLLGNHSLDLWKSMNSSANSGLEDLQNARRNVDSGQSGFDSSVNVLDGGAAEMHGTENGRGRENSSDSHQSIFPNHTLAGSVKENAWSDTGDERSLSGAQDMGDQIGRRLPGSRKIEYHPMGDVDVNEQKHSQNPSSGLKGNDVQQRFLSGASSSTELDKGLLSRLHGATKMPLGVSSSGFLASYLPNAAVPFTRFGEHSSPNQHMSPSQNMLELLHKVDQSKDQNAIANLSSPELSGFPDTPVVGSVGPGASQPSTSHAVNLQLAPPSQGIASSNFNDPAQSSFTMADSPSSQLAPSETGEKAHTRLGSGASPQCLQSSNRPPQGKSISDLSGTSGNLITDGSQANPNGNFTTSMISGSPYLRNPCQNQQMSAAGRQMMGNQLSNISSDQRPYHDQQMTTYQNQSLINQPINNLHSGLEVERYTNQSGMRPSMHQVVPSMHAGMAGWRNDAGRYLWNSQQQLLAAHSRNASDLRRSPFQSNYAADSFFSQQKKCDPDGQRNAAASSAQAVVAAEESVEEEPRCSGKTDGASQEETLARQPMDASPSSSTASQKETGPFHQSLRPNSMAQRSHSMLHQMRAMQNAAIDPGNRETKRLKGADDKEAHQLSGKAAEPVTGGMNSMLRDSSVNCTSISSGDAKMLSFSPQTGNRITSHQFPQGPVSSQDMLSFGRGRPEKFVDGPVASRAPHMGISPRMAQSWFEKYGENGESLPVHNVPRVQMVKSADQQLLGGNLPSNVYIENPVLSAKAVTESRQICPNSYPPTEHVTSLHALVPSVSVPSPVSFRPKKRKTATSDLIPWNKEIVQGFRRLQNISLAEVDWAQSSNRLVERAEDIIDTHEDLLPMARSRRRLILSTKLMQQVFRSPSASVLSLDARCAYEVIVYSLARLALRDACSLISGVESDSAPDNGTLLSVKAKMPGLRGQYFSKVVEDLTNRAKELENDLLRLDKQTSILDFRLDCLDLERFSVINRFARFHGRSQADGAEATSSYGTTAMSQKPCLHRYVSAHSMPRIVPDRVQCLSL